MKKMLGLIVVLLLALALLVGCGGNADDGEGAGSSDADTIEQDVTQLDSGAIWEGDMKKVKIEIEDFGDVVLELNETAAPITVANFLQLVDEGFYDGLTFHRIIDGFMIQGGDPEGTGMGGSGTNITGEFAQNGINNPISHLRGIISMARSADPDSASSQFFIVHQDSTFLDHAYAAFGRVIEGIEVVDAIAENTPVIDDNGSVQQGHKPVIKRITILD